MNAQTKPLAGVLLGATGLLILLAAVSRAKAAKAAEQTRALETAQPPGAPPAPQLPSSSTAPQLPSSTDKLPDHPVKLTDAPAPPAPAPTGDKPTARTAKQAAQALYDYVTRMIRAGQGAQLGSKGKPNATVQAAQTDMRGVQADGIYGPKTMARGKELLGREFPPRVSKHAPAQPGPRGPLAPQTRVVPPPAPPAAPPPASQPIPVDKPIVIDIQADASNRAAGRAPQKAAEDLLVYVTEMKRAGKAAQLGSKGKPNATVAAAQRDMGHIANVDGIYGPATRARGKQLIGKDFPAR